VKYIKVSKESTKTPGKVLTACVPVFDEEYQALVEREMEGFCLSCGSQVGGVEPDARRYECESCGESRVYGLEELLLMNLIVINPRNSKVYEAS
jgi:predicted RNA-binding Zn-ribbon protein involved in translation (DUF1610 family)